jgi:hypothetical protein
VLSPYRLKPRARIGVPTFRKVLVYSDWGFSSSYLKNKREK